MRTRRCSRHQSWCNNFFPCPHGLSLSFLQPRWLPSYWRKLQAFENGSERRTLNKAGRMENKPVFLLQSCSTQSYRSPGQWASDALKVSGLQLTHQQWLLSHFCPVIAYTEAYFGITSPQNICYQVFISGSLSDRDYSNTSYKNKAKEWENS